MRHNERPACQLSVQRAQQRSLTTSSNICKALHVAERFAHPLAVFFHVHSFCTALDGSNTPAFALTPYDPASCFLTHCAPALIVLGARMRTSAGGPAVELDQQYCKIRKHPTANALYDQHCQQPRVRCNAGQCTS